MGFIQAISWFLYLAAYSAFALDPIAEAEDNRQANSPALVAAMKSPKISERQRAANAYGRIQKPESVDPLLELLKDTHPSVREAAAFALGQLGWERAFSGSR